MALRDRLRSISADSERRVLVLFDRWRAGGLSDDEFVASVAAVVARADLSASRMGDVAVAVQLSRMLRSTVGPVATEVGDQRGRLARAVRTLLAEMPEVARTPDELAESRRARLSRLAAAEPLQRGQEAVQANLARTGAGWVRATGPAPCPLCRELADGIVRPASTRMATHTGCSCVQRPAVL